MIARKKNYSETVQYKNIENFPKRANFSPFSQMQSARQSKLRQKENKIRNGEGEHVVDHVIKHVQSIPQIHYK